MIEILSGLMRRPKGIVRLYEDQPPLTRAYGTRASPSPGRGARRAPGRLLFECDNLYVNAGLPVLANLLAGNTAGYIAAAVGFGSGNTPPTVGDTDLTTAPKYYNAIGTHTIGPSGTIAPGSVLFNYALAPTDYAANPLTIQELGLFANSGAVVLPVLIGGTFGAWASSHAYGAGNLITDSNGNTQRCTTAGNSGAAAPSWSTAWAAQLRTTPSSGRSPPCIPRRVR